MVVVRIACGVETGHAFVSGGMTYNSTYNVMICVLLFVDRVTVEAVPQSGYLTVTDELRRAVTQKEKSVTVYSSYIR